MGARTQSIAYDPKPDGRESSHVGALRDRWFLAILLVALAVRTYHLNYPAWDHYSWQQAKNLMLARDFARHGFSLPYSTVLKLIREQPAESAYFAGELPIHAAIAAVLYQLFGESDMLARVAVIGFSLLSVFFLYKLVFRRAGQLAGCLAAIVYALLPYSIFFGRVLTPNLTALTFALGGLCSLDRWVDERKWTWLLAAAVLSSLAMLQELLTILVCVPALYVLWKALGRGLVRRPEPYVFVAIVGLPALAWYAHVEALARAARLTIYPFGGFASHISLWLEPAFGIEVLRRLAREAFSFPGLLLLVGGFLGARHPGAQMFRVWAAATVILLLLVPDGLAANPACLLLLAPGGAALGGLVLEPVAAHARWRPLVVLFMPLLAADAIRSARVLYQPDRAPWDLGVLLKRLAAPQELIATESLEVLYAADRSGWVLEDYDLRRLDQVTREGAHYYARLIVKNGSEHSEFIHGLDTRFEHLTTSDSLASIYFLSKPSTFVGEVPSGEIQIPFLVDFGDEIELLGVSMRNLLASPTSFEITYYWRCLKPIRENLAVFVHITNPSGETSYQQDHWPAAGHYPTAVWKKDEIIRERYVVIVPSSLPAGLYQIRVGWYDPASKRRLPITLAGTSDGADRAPAAEFEVHSAPSYGWFSVEE